MKNGKAKAKINIFYETKLPFPAKDEKLFKKLVRAGLGKFALENLEINLVFVGSKKIKELNKKFLGKNSVTDVIAFNYIPPFVKGGREGIFSPFLIPILNLIPISVLAPRSCGDKLILNPILNKGGIYPFGDIFISIPQAQKQARYFKHSLKKELGILTVHGALHLAGFDHKTPAQKTKMQKKTDEIIGKILK